jgi:hypothetical protein
VKTFGSPASRSRALQPEMPAGGALPRVRTRHHPLPSAIPPLPRRPSPTQLAPSAKRMRLNSQRGKRPFAEKSNCDDE